MYLAGIRSFNTRSSLTPPPHLPHITFPGSPRLPKRDEFLGTCGVNGNAGIEVLLGGAHLDGDAEALQHLAGPEAHDVQADDLLVGAVADDLVLGGALVGGVHHGVVHGGEVGGVDLEVLAAVLVDGLGLRQADGADLGVGEDDAGDVGVVEARVGEDGGGAVEALGKAAASGDGDGGQLCLAADVAEREDVVDRGVLELVDDDVALVVELHAGLLEAEVVCLGHAADGPDEVVEVGYRALAVAVLVVYRQLAGGGVLVDTRLRRLLVQMHAQALVLGRHAILDHRVEMAQEGLVADEEVGLDAEGVEHAGEFDGDVAGADERDLLGQGGDVEEAVAVDAVLGAGDVGEAGGAAADGDHDAVRAHCRLGAVIQGDLGLVLGQQPRTAVDVLDLVVGQIPLVDAVQPLHVGVPLLLKTRPVERCCLLDAEPVGLALVYGLCDGGGVEGDLFWHTASLGGHICQEFIFVTHTHISRAGRMKLAYPTLTQVPPNLLDSTIMALAPNFPLAMRAAPRPPLPPPMTRKSVSLETGAMMREAEESCLERDVIRETAVLAK